MTAKIHLPTPRDTSVEWPYLARHYHAGSPVQQGSCIGLPRQYAPPPDFIEPDAAHEAHPQYIGVYLETAKPRRWYYAVELDGRTLHGYGFNSPAKAARAYDDCVRVWGIDRPLNFADAEAKESA